MAKMKEQQDLKTQQMASKYEELMELERNEIAHNHKETISNIYDENTV